MLVVDDDPRSAKLLEGYLRGEGYQVRTAPDGQTALSLAREEAQHKLTLEIEYDWVAS